MSDYTQEQIEAEEDKALNADIERYHEYQRRHEAPTVYADPTPDRRPENRLMCCETTAHASGCPNNPNSLGFDEPGLWMVDEWIAEGVVGAMRKPSPADLIDELATLLAPRGRR